MKQHENPLDAIVAQLDGLIESTKKDKWAQEKLSAVIRSVIEYNNKSHYDTPPSDESAAILARLKQQYTSKREWSFTQSDVIEGIIIKQAEMLLEATRNAKHADEIIMMSAAYNALNHIVSDYDEITDLIPTDLVHDIGEAADWRQSELEKPTELNKFEGDRSIEAAQKDIAYQKQYFASKRKNKE